jgi:L-rhamnose-H+ transport protein
MQIIIGVIYHFIGGFASGSFYVPYRRVKGWSWESYWLVGGLFSWLIVPPLAAWLTVPGFAEMISGASASAFWWTYVWGLLSGIGGLLYGLGMRYLGMSLGNSVLLGFTAAFGALVPAIYYDAHPETGKTTFSDLLHTSWGRVVLGGVALCLVGIAICGRAGMLKERELTDEKKKASIREFALIKGLLVCIASGILSACFNYGIEAGAPMADIANQQWHLSHPGMATNFLFRNNVTYVVLLWGGLTSNVVWCILLNLRNRSFGDYGNRKAPIGRNYLFCALAGTTWFLQFFFYGMGESKLGNGASSWILHMAFIILVANAWGFALKEWKGVSGQTKVTILTGVALIILSVALVGYGNAIK